MAIPTLPSITEIRARIIADVESVIGQTVPLLPKSFVGAIAGAVAGWHLLQYKAALWVYRQIFPDTADYDALVLLGKLVGIAPTDPVKWVGVVSLTGTNGSVVTSGVLASGSNGEVYEITTGGTVAGGVASVTFTAITSGDSGTLANGETLTLLEAVTGFTGTGTVTSTTTDGADAETEEHFRNRVNIRYKKRLTGGSPADYELWGLETPNFIWVNPLDGDAPGEVIVYGEVDNQTDGIPTAGQLTSLLSYLTVDPETGLAARSPIGDEITCLPISRKIFDVEIQIKDGTTDIKANITTALSDYMYGLEPYNEGLSLVRDDAVTDSGASAAAGEIAREGGATILQLVVRENSTSAQVNNYILYGGEKAKLGTVTFTDIS